MRKLILLVTFFINLYSNATVDDRAERQALIQVSHQNSYKKYIENLFPEAIITESVRGFQIWKAEFKDSVPMSKIIKLYREGKITSYIKNRILSARNTIPNDSFFSSQWHHFNNFNPGQNVTYGINSIGAWDFQKGGTTTNGDTIVVAVLDFGFDSTHEDLDYFINYNEIPNDGIDNDNNGAIDDYKGWNVGNNNSNLLGSDNIHGTMVCGGIAAIGNNQKGVAGVAWHCKLLPLNNIGTIDNSITALEYCLKMRRLYNETGGQKGAYIVAVNYSLGAQGFLPEDEPLWCAAFDSLGNVGIISCVAATNDNANSESVMDMPILCNEETQINVTTYDKNTLGLSGNGYSNKYVHLAAADKYYTTTFGNKYSISKDGTSHATPLVSGAIALMYSNFDKKVLDTLEKNPRGIAKKIKDIILKNVDITDGLTDKVVSNGKLNLYKNVIAAIALHDSLFKQDSIPTALIIEKTTQVELYSYSKNVVIKKSNTLPLFLSVYNMIGQEVYKKTIVDDTTVLNLEFLNSGIYIVNYYFDGHYFTKKIVLQN